MPGADSDSVQAYLGESDGEIFVQPADERAQVLCNGNALASSKWLRHGDLVEVEGGALLVEVEGASVRLVVQSRLEQSGPLSGESVAEGTSELRITPVRFEPSRLAATRSRSWRPSLLMLLVGLFVAALAGAGWYVFSSHPVRIAVSPEPESMEVEGGLWTPRLGGRHLLRRGSYRLSAERAGYRRLDAELIVTDAGNQVFEYQLEPLPALLRVSVEPSDVRAIVAVDGIEQGAAPVEGIEVEEGEHTVTVTAAGFRPYEETISAEVAADLEVRAVLTDLRAAVTFTSDPSGVSVVVDGARLGETPLTVSIPEGAHGADWLMGGFKPARSRFEVEAGVELSVAAPALTPADGNLVVSSEPADAAVSVDGIFRGRTPLDLDLTPGASHRVALSKDGYAPAEREVELAPGKSETLSFVLEEQIVELRVESRPPGAEVLVDGESRGLTSTEGLVIELAGAGPHEVEVRKDGYVAQRRSVTPRPGFAQSLGVELKSEEQVQAERTPPTIRTHDGQDLRLIAGGRFQMGASRREPGRRPNESQRDVELTRRFYIATREVSNESFRKFDPSHFSGKAGSTSLELDHHPVVQVSWEAAARYCNWMSEKESLPPAYRLEGGRLVPVEPMNTGYRLPTEAEWVWVTRYPESPTVRKYPWGDSLPVPPLAGNFGDSTARSILGRSLPGYSDGFAATSPVDSFEPNPLGLWNLGGNVAEWMTDRYAIDPRSGETPERDPMGPSSGEQHTIRGSSWSTATVTALRLSYRDAGEGGRPDVGFRIARYAE